MNNPKPPKAALGSLLSLMYICFLSGASAASPGGVTSGLTEWFDAGSGVSGSSGSFVWNRKDFNSSRTSEAQLRELANDGQGASAGTITYRVGAVNFNPAFQFGPRSYFGPVSAAARLRSQDDIVSQKAGSGFGVGIGSDQLITVAYGQPDVLLCGTARCDVGTRSGGTQFGGDTSRLGTGTTTTNGGTAYAGGSADGPTANLYGLWADAGAGTNSATGQTNTRNGWTNTGPAVQRLPYPSYELRIGGFPGYTYSDSYNNGLITEGIYFDRKLSDNEAQRVSSYLAIKYGITLDADGTRRNATNYTYLSSAGTQVWSGSSSPYSTYHNNVFGIGADTASDLDQRISTSVNNSGPVGSFPLDILTIANGAAVGTAGPGAFTYTVQTDSTGLNPGSGPALSDGQFLMVGNDAGSTTAATSGVAVAASADTRVNGSWTRLNRRWIAQNTGGVGAVSLNFNLPTAGVTALGSNLKNVVLLVDDDGNYTNGGTRVVTNGVVSGTQISFNTTFASGEVFTLAYGTVNVTFRKTTNNGTSGSNTFNFTLNAADAESGATTNTATAALTVANNGTATGTANTVDFNTNLTLSEANTASFVVTALSCINATAGGPTFSPTYDPVGRTITIPAGMVNIGAAITCTFTNSPGYPVRLTKNWVNGKAGDAVSLTVGGGSGTATAAGTSTPVATTNATANGLPGSTITVTEAFTTGTASNYNVSLVCINVTTGATVTTAQVGATSRTFTMPAGALGGVTCTYTNSRVAQQLNLAKAWGSGSLSGHTASATTTGGTNNPTFTSAAPDASTGTAVTVYAGDTVTLPAETFGGGATGAAYTTTVACAGGTPLSSAAPGATITVAATTTATTCTYTNAPNPGTLSVTKTITGGPAPRTAALTFSFTVACQTPTASYSGSVTVAANATAGTTTLGNVPAGSSSCAVTEGALPAAPSGYAWGTPSYVQPSGTLAPAGTLSATITNPLTPQPDLTITKTHTGTWTQGDSGRTYTVTVTNSGLGPTSGAVTVTDTLPGGLTATALSGTGWSCTLATLTCTRSDALAAGSSYPVLTLTVNVSTTAPGNVTNTATASGSNESNTGNNTATDPTTIAAYVAGADLAISKTGQAFSTPGEAITYTIRVWNNGPNVATTTISDTVPGVLTGVTWTCAATGTATCGALGGAGNTINLTATLTVDTDPITSADTNFVTVTVRARAPETATLENVAGSRTFTNTASVASSVTDPSPGNDSSSFSTTMVYAKLSKTVRNVTTGAAASSSGSGLPGDTLEYCIAFNNYGNAPLDNFVITDAVPGNTTPQQSAYDADESSAATGFGVKLTRGTVTSYYTSSEIDADSGSLTASGGPFDRGTLSVSLATVTVNESGSACFQTRIN